MTTLTDDQINGMVLRVNRVAATSFQFALLSAANQGGGEPPTVTLMAKQESVNGGVASQQAYHVAQIINLATGTAPNLTQQINWTSYLNSGNSEASMVDAFCCSDVFGTRFNGGVDFTSGTDPVSAACAKAIIEAAHAGAGAGGVATQTQIDAWTGYAVHTMFSAFAVGDQYTAAIQAHAVNYFKGNINGYLHGTAYPTGDIWNM